MIRTVQLNTIDYFLAEIGDESNAIEATPRFRVDVIATDSTVDEVFVSLSALLSEQIGDQREKYLIEYIGQVGTHREHDAPHYQDRSGLDRAEEIEKEYADVCNGRGFALKPGKLEIF